MGEIGIPRREFLYDIDFWEVDIINKGYRKRQHLTHQLLAECTYATMFTMRDPKGKTVQDLFPHIFDDDEDEDGAQDQLTEEDRKELQQLIDNCNKKGGKK